MAYEGSQRLGELFKSRREKGKPGLPTLSVTLNNGLVDRDSLGRKTDTNLAEDEHLLVRKGDLVYNMMRMWQGASGLAEKDGLVSPAYVVLAPKAKIDSRYASYLFKSQRMIYLFWAYSYGLTSDRLRLYHRDFARIPVTVPSLPEQLKVVEILSTFDQAIDACGKLIDATYEKKRSLIQRLVSGTIRLPGFSGPLKKVEVSEFCTLVKDKTNPISSDSSLRCIELEHIDSETGQLLGATTIATQASVKNAFAASDVLFGKLRPYLKKSWFADSSGYCSTEIWVLRANTEICLPAFLSLICQTDRFAKSCHVTAGSKMPRAEWSIVSRAPFVMPSLEEQFQISSIIDVANKESETFQSQLLALQQQKRALTQQLLTGKRRVKLDSSA